jgi:hypothetical protein
MPRAMRRPRPRYVSPSSSCRRRLSRPRVDEEVDVVAQSWVNGAVQVQPHNATVLRVPRARGAARPEQCAKGIDGRLPEIDPRPSGPDTEDEVQRHGPRLNGPCAAKCVCDLLLEGGCLGGDGCAQLVWLGNRTVRGLCRANAEERCRAVPLGATDRHERPAERLREVADGREQVVVEVALIQKISAVRQPNVESEGESAVSRRYERSGQLLKLAQVSSERRLRGASQGVPTLQAGAVGNGKSAAAGAYWTRTTLMPLLLLNAAAGRRPAPLEPCASRSRRTSAAAGHEDASSRRMSSMIQRSADTAFE